MVKLVQDKVTGQEYALKIIPKKITEKNKEINLRQEAEIHIGLNHNNIVRLHNYFENKDNIYLVLEYWSKGSLFKLIKDNRYLSEKQVYSYFTQVCAGVKYLHSKGLIHRDLKPENILIANDNTLKIWDFGWCVQTQDDTPRTTFCGTFEYMAPEMISSRSYTYTLDIWCLGILLYEMLHGEAPFTGKDNKVIIEKIKRGSFQFNNSRSSKEVQDLVLRLLRRNPDVRISIDDIFNHKWIKIMQRKYRIFNTPQKKTPQKKTRSTPNYLRNQSLRLAFQKHDNKFGNAKNDEKELNSNIVFPEDSEHEISESSNGSKGFNSKEKSQPRISPATFEQELENMNKILENKSKLRTKAQIHQSKYGGLLSQTNATSQKQLHQNKFDEEDHENKIIEFGEINKEDQLADEHQLLLLDIQNYAKENKLTRKLRKCRTKSITNNNSMPKGIFKSQTNPKLNIIKEFADIQIEPDCLHKSHIEDDDFKKCSEKDIKELKKPSREIKYNSTKSPFVNDILRFNDRLDSIHESDASNKNDSENFQIEQAKSPLNASKSFDYECDKGSEVAKRIDDAKNRIGTENYDKNLKEALYKVQNESNEYSSQYKAKENSDGSYDDSLNLTSENQNLKTPIAQTQAMGSSERFWKKEDLKEYIENIKRHDLYSPRTFLSSTPKNKDNSICNHNIANSSLNDYDEGTQRKDSNEIHQNNLWKKKLQIQIDDEDMSPSQNDEYSQNPSIIINPIEQPIKPAYVPDGSNKKIFEEQKSAVDLWIISKDKGIHFLNSGISKRISFDTEDKGYINEDPSEDISSSRVSCNDQNETAIINEMYKTSPERESFKSDTNSIGALPSNKKSKPYVGLVKK